MVDPLANIEPAFAPLVPVEALERARARRAEGRALLLNGNKPGYSERFTIEVEQYDLLVEAILEAAEQHANERGETLLQDIVASVQARLGSHAAFPKGRMTNFTRYAKVDLEARGYLRRVEGRSPQRVRRHPL